MGTIELQEDEKEMVGLEAEVFASRAGQDRIRNIFTRIGEQARAGWIEEDLAGPLGGLLEVGLSSGRIRSIYGAHAEMAASRLFRLTPPGRALQDQVRQSNEALKQFAESTLKKLTISARGPGLFTLTLETSLGRTALSLTPAGLEVRSLEVSL